MESLQPPATLPPPDRRSSRIQLGHQPLVDANTCAGCEGECLGRSPILGQHPGSGDTRSQHLLLEPRDIGMRFFRSRRDRTHGGIVRTKDDDCHEARRYATAPRISRSRTVSGSAAS